MRALVAALASSLGLSGCAWANRENRPVWSAFEEHLVPDDDAAFVATLPLTVPGGLIAIVLDTFVVHPAMVADDAWRDSADLWDDLEWREHYYTELAGLPLRAVATPVLFAGSFLGRSLFDVEPHRSAADEAELADRRERALLAWFEHLAAGGREPYDREDPGRWSDALAAAFERARETAGPRGRIALYAYAQRRALPPWTSEPELGLRDPDPVVRYRMLERRPARVPPQVRRALLADPNEAVRELAAELWAESGR